jgi:hypothetical protein
VGGHHPASNTPRRWPHAPCGATRRAGGLPDECLATCDELGMPSLAARDRGASSSEPDAPVRRSQLARATPSIMHRRSSPVPCRG